MPKITFLKTGVTVKVVQGCELLAAYEQHPDIPLKFGCRQGECGVCLIDISSGAHHLTKCSAREAETLKRKHAHPTCRLACQCALNGDIEIN